MLVLLPLAWLGGGLFGALARSTGPLELVTTLSFGAVGTLLAVDAKLTRPMLATLACLAGALHGFENGATLAPDAGPALALCGVALAVFTLVTLLSASVVGLRATWARVAVRVAGSWIAAIGLLQLGWMLREATPDA